MSSSLSYGCGSSSCHGATYAYGGRRYDSFANAKAYVNSAGYGWQYNYIIGNTRVQANEMPAATVTDAQRTLIKTLMQGWRDGGGLQNANAQMTTGSATSVGKYSAVLNASVIENGIDTTFTMRYSTNSGTIDGGGGTADSLGSPSGTGGGNNSKSLNTGTISGLTCGTTYYYRVSGTTGGPGTRQNFSTSTCPTVTTISDVNTNENTSVSFTVGSTNRTSETVSYSLDATSLARGMTINSSTGAFSWPAASIPQNTTVSTNYSVTVTASYSGTGVSAPNDTDVFIIAVAPVNDAPTFTNSAGTAATESVAYSYDANATDIEGNAYSFSLISGPAGMTVNSSTGLVSWTPTEALSNYTQGVTIRVTDSGGAFTNQSWTINVSANNDSPTFSSVAVTAASESVAYLYTAAAPTRKARHSPTAPRCCRPGSASIPPRASSAVHRPKPRPAIPTT